MLLKDLEIEEVSLVEVGANPEAKIMLLKSRAKGELGEEMSELKALTLKLKKSMEAAQAQQDIEALRKYEVLGTRAEKLHSLLSVAKAKDPALYQATMQTLDEAFLAVNKSGRFSELGTSRTGFGLDVEATARQIQKTRPQMSYREALDKAYQQARRELK